MSLLTTLQHHTRLAYRALNGVLQPGIWVQQAAGVYDPETGEVVEPEPVRVPVSVLVSSYPLAEVDGVRILAYRPTAVRVSGAAHGYASPDAADTAGAGA